MANNVLDQDLVYEATLGSATKVEHLLNKGADPDVKNPEGWTALAIAANRIDKEALPIVKLLVESGADINAGRKGYSPVINATRNSQVEVASYLLKNGADPRSVDHNGRDLVWISKHVREPELQEIIDELFEKEREKEELLRTEDHLKILVEEYSFALCEAKYWAFYIASRQDSRVNKAKLKKHISQRISDANHTNRQIAMYFPNLNVNEFNNITKQSQSIIYNQLNNLISNRNRKKLGVGTREDMEQRCSKISNSWNATLKTIETF